MIIRPRRPNRARRNPRTGNLAGPDSFGTVVSNSAATGGAPPGPDTTYGTSEQSQTFTDQSWSGQDYGTLSAGIGSGIGGILSGIGDIINADSSDPNDASAGGAMVPGSGGGGGAGVPMNLSGIQAKPFPWSMVLLALAAVGGIAFFALRGKGD